jgi:hypothetical protein
MTFPSAAALCSLLLWMSLDAAPEDLYSLRGKDAAVEDLLKSGAIIEGQRMGKGPARGARVVVNHQKLERLTGKLPALDVKSITGIQHQAGHGTRRNFADWSRFYQEDGNTQIFRLHKGDWQFRDPSREEARQGRIEAYNRPTAVRPGTWLEWEGTYTLIQPISACIFQLFHEGDQLWAFHLLMNDKGDISFHRRRNEAGKERRIVLGENMIGKALGVRVRGNAHQYELYVKLPGSDGEWRKVTDGTYVRGKDDKLQFRWGMYLGQSRGRQIPHDALFFVSGTTIRTIAAGEASGG